MNKKGLEERQYLWTFYLLILSIVLITLITYIQSVSQGEIISKDFIASDISFLIQAIQAAPGDVSYRYELSNNEFNILINNNEVIISDDRNNLDSRKSVYFKNKNVDLESVFLEKPSILVLEKKSNTITITSTANG